MFINTDVKGVEFLDAKLDGSDCGHHQMLGVRCRSQGLHCFSMVHVQASVRFPTPDQKYKA